MRFRFRSLFRADVPDNSETAPEPEVAVVQTSGRYCVNRAARGWSTPPLLAAKCLLRYRKAQEVRFTDAYDELMRKLPFLAEHYEQEHGVPLTREVVQGRFHTTRAKVRSWPRTSAVARQYWPVARVPARVDGPISRERLEALARLFEKQGK